MSARPYCAKLAGPCPDGCAAIQLVGCGGGVAGDCWRVKQPAPAQAPVLYQAFCDLAAAWDEKQAAIKEWSNDMSSAAIQTALIDSVIDYGKACADELPESKAAWLQDVREKVEGIQQNAYSEGRRDEANEHAWHSIESAPEDTNVLVATQGGWVDTAFWTNEDGEGRKWWWLISPTKYEPHPINPRLIPTHWMPLPKHPGDAA